MRDGSPTIETAEALTPEAGAEPVPGYRLLRRLGRGGFGEVWEAEGPGGFRIALKFVRLSPRARVAELRALEFVREIRHPNLLASFGSWRVGETLVIGMELADRSLWDRFIEAADAGLAGIPRAELLGYFAGVADAVNHLNDRRHELGGRLVGVQHRDLKPPNILLCGAGAKVADLGMARAMAGEASGHTGVWTYGYAAPEFFHGRTTRHSDQYSLAATFCQLRAGRLPHEGNAAAVAAGHLFGRPVLDALPAPERPILERALSKEPGDRWPDCRSFVAALRALKPTEVPELIREAPDIPRECRSSTGALLARRTVAGPSDSLGDAPPPSWHEFESTDSLEALLMTPDCPPPVVPPPTSPTALRPAAEPESGPEPPEVPTPTPTPSRARRRSRLGRFALASALASVAIMATSGVRPLPFAEHDPRPPAAIEARPEPEPGPVPEPIVVVSRAEPAPEPELILAPAPAPEPEARPQPQPDPVPPIVDEPPAAPAPLVDRVRPVAVLVGRLLDSPTVVPAPGADLQSEAAEARGREALARGEFDRAEGEFAQAIRLDPTRPSAYFHRGLARHHARRLREALEDYAEAARLRPLDPAALVASGQAHHDLGDYDRAVDAYGRAIGLRPGDASARYRRGLARYHAGDNPGAVADFTEAIRLDPKLARAYQYRGDALARLGQARKAAADHDRASALEATQARPAKPLAPLPSTARTRK